MVLEAAQGLGGACGPQLGAAAGSCPARGRCLGRSWRGRGLLGVPGGKGCLLRLFWSLRRSRLGGGVIGGRVLWSGAAEVWRVEGEPAGTLSGLAYCGAAGKKDGAWGGGCWGVTSCRCERELDSLELAKGWEGINHSGELFGAPSSRFLNTHSAARLQWAGPPLPPTPHTGSSSKMQFPSPSL